jgi:hypothetical protein
VILRKLDAPSRTAAAPITAARRRGHGS